MKESDHKKTREGKTIQPDYFSLNANSNNTEAMIRPSFDPYDKKSKHAHMLQLNRAMAWFPALGMGLVRVN